MLLIDNGMAVLEKGRLEVFVYQKYLGRLANVSGDTVTSIGLLPYRWFSKWDDIKPAKTGTVKIPSEVEFHPSEVVMDEKIKIYPESDEKDYTVMTFFEKDRCWSSFLVQSMGVSMDFTKSLLKNQIDTNVPYNILSPYWQATSIYNKFNLGVSGPSMDLIVRQICRYKKNRDIIYAKVLEKHPEIGQVSYQFLTARDLCATSGVFPSISFEDINAMIDNSINITATNKPQGHSPVEDIIYL